MTTTKVTYELQRRVIPGSIMHEFEDREWITMLPARAYNGKDENLDYMRGRLDKYRITYSKNDYRLIRRTVTVTEEVLDF